MTRFYGLPVLGAVLLLVGVASFSPHEPPPSSQSNNPLMTRIPSPPASDTAPTSTPVPAPLARTRPSTPSSGIPGEATNQPPSVAVVIDDLGWNKTSVSMYEQIRAPLTMALLPDRPYSDWFYDRWVDRFEFLIHMPMEPLDYPRDDPGEGALMTSMSRREVTRRVRGMLEKYPEVVGVNNHMGSAFTQQRAGMSALMKVLARRDLLFLDSLTTSRSVGEQMARKWGVPTLRNDVFLDRDRTRGAIRRQFETLIRRARRRGHAVAIGHFQSIETARVLREQIPRYRKQGVNFITLSEMVRVVR